MADFAGHTMTVDGVEYGAGENPAVWRDQGYSLPFEFYTPNVAAENQKRYTWDSTGGLTTTRTGTIPVQATGSVTGNYAIQWAVIFKEYGLYSNQGGVGSIAGQEILSIEGTHVVYGQFAGGEYVYWVNNASSIEYVWFDLTNQWSQNFGGKSHTARWIGEDSGNYHPPTAITGSTTFANKYYTVNQWTNPAPLLVPGVGMTIETTFDECYLGKVKGQFNATGGDTQAYISYRFGSADYAQLASGTIKRAQPSYLEGDAQQKAPSGEALQVKWSIDGSIIPLTGGVVLDYEIRRIPAYADNYGGL
jgi:hypothetical protein